MKAYCLELKSVDVTGVEQAVERVEIAAAVTVDE